jgi:hypothetical protein
MKGRAAGRQGAPRERPAVRPRAGSRLPGAACRRRGVWDDALSTHSTHGAIDDTRSSPPPASSRRSLLRAVGHKEAPAEVKAALTTDEGEELEIVEEPLPEQFDPERKGAQGRAGMNQDETPRTSG